MIILMMTTPIRRTEDSEVEVEVKAEVEIEIQTVRNR